MNAPAQLSLFESISASSLPIGLCVIMPKPCRNCGSDAAVIGSSRGPHHARLNCECCDSHRGWLSGTAYKFLSDVIENCGRPTEPIEIRHNQSSSPDADNPAVATATQPTGDL
jgi:hypothetical protein